MVDEAPASGPGESPKPRSDAAPSAERSGTEPPAAGTTRFLSPRAVLRIARWEVSTAAGELDRRVAIATVLVVLALLGAGVAAGGVTDTARFDQGLYRVGIDDGHVLYPAVANDSTFQVREPSTAALEDGRQELLIRGDRIRGVESPKARAAVSELRAAVVRYNDRLMATEANGSAAFPVTVELRYRERAVADISAPGGTEPPPAEPPSTPTEEGPTRAPTQTGGGGASTPGSGTPTGAGETPGPGPTATPATDGTATPAPTATPPPGEDGDTQSGGGGPIGVPSTGPLFGGGSGGTPSDITPPFPFQSLILAFLFVIPMNFVIQAYGSSILGERLDRRGEPLLVAPVSRLDIVAGKTLPYLGLMVLVAGVTAAAIGGSPVSLAAVTPLALLFLAATFLGAMFARSYRELTFVTVAVSTGLTAYAFVPAIFSSVGSVGLISPLTLVVRDLQGTAITPLEFAFSTGPLAVTAAILFALGASVYREEDMFTQRALSAKALDALARHVSGPSSVAVVVALSVPFVFVAELLTVALLVAIPVEVSIPVLVALIVVIEEAAKSLPIFAGYEHDRFPDGTRTAAALGVASGLGFFVAEKGTLAAQLVGLTDLTQGQAAFGPGASLPLPTPVLLLLPLALHVTTATVSSLGAERGDWPYLVALAGAILLHATYNLSLLVIGGVV